MVNKYTNPEKRNENEAVTITNRLGQLSISLPRITDDKRLRGYPGLAGTANRIAQLVPSNVYYVEPFAGTAKVFQETSISKFMGWYLNDKSKFVYQWLLREFGDRAHISNLDFNEIFDMFEDRPNASIVIDQPWHKSFYDKEYSCFDRKDVKTYDMEILKRCGKVKGVFLICSDRKNPRMLKSGFNNYLVTGEYMVAGGYTKTLVTTNQNLDITDKPWVTKI